MKNQLTPEQWAQARELFEFLCERPIEEQGERLQPFDHDDPVRCEVERLIEVERGEDQFLETPIEHQWIAQGANRDREGEHIGEFRIGSLIASGGMATVYEAHQSDPDRLVALKVLRQGLASTTARERFRYEAELLGRLAHPGIAQVYRAGVLEEEGGPGTPWFALEFVEGARTITDFAKESGLDLRQRLRLFLQLLDAIQHGHQRAVVHRDLKPQNVLVSDQGHLKVIDFGVARQLDSVSDLERTREGELIGTLRSMSPEQLSGRPQDVDARTDIYSLGVLLHELVSDEHPYDLRGRSITEVGRIVRDVEPTPPTAQRHGLPPELDWICAKSMAKLPADRYDTTSSFAEDIKALLAGEAVSVGPKSRRYRAGKLIRKHWRAVLAASALLLTMMAGFAGTAVGLWKSTQAEARAQRERGEAIEQADTAREMLTFLLEAIEAPAPRRSGKDVTMAEFLEIASSDIDERFRDRPRIRGSLHSAVGRSFHDLGDHERAGLHLRTATEALRDAEGTPPLELAGALISLSVSERESGRFGESEACLLEAKALLDGESASDSQARVRLMLELRTKRAQLLISLGEMADAIEQLEALLPELQEHFHEHDPVLLTAMHDLGSAFHKSDRLSDAEPLYRRTLEGWIARRGADFSEAIQVRASLVVLLHAAGRSADAAAQLEELLAVNRRTLGSSHTDTVLCMNNLAGIYYLQKEYAKAAPLFREALEVLETQVASDHPMIALLKSNLGTCELTLGNLEQAAPLLRAAFDLRTESLGPAHNDTLRVLYELARLEGKQGNHERENELYMEGLDRLLAEFDETHPRFLHFELQYAHSLIDLDQAEEARAIVEEAQAAFERGERKVEASVQKDVQDLFTTIQGRLQRIGQ